MAETAEGPSLYEIDDCRNALRGYVARQLSVALLALLEETTHQHPEDFRRVFARFFGLEAHHAAVRRLEAALQASTERIEKAGRFAAKTADYARDAAKLTNEQLDAILHRVEQLEKRVHECEKRGSAQEGHQNQQPRGGHAGPVQAGPGRAEGG